jgi:hypothetical protein
MSEIRRINLLGVGAYVLGGYWISLMNQPTLQIGGLALLIIGAICANLP